MNKIPVELLKFKGLITENKNDLNYNDYGLLHTRRGKGA